MILISAIFRYHHRAIRHCAATMIIGVDSLYNVVFILLLLELERSYIIIGWLAGRRSGNYLNSSGRQAEHSHDMDKTTDDDDRNCNHRRLLFISNANLITIITMVRIS